MLLADLGQTWGPIVAGGIALVVFAGLAILLIKGHRWFTAAADRAQRRAFDGIPVSDTPAPGHVNVVFHTYCGLIVFTRQVEYRFWATPEHARIALSRLHRFNLTWGFFAYGAILIPLLSLGNYWAQLRRINKQENQPAQ